MDSFFIVLTVGIGVCSFLLGLYLFCYFVGSVLRKQTISHWAFPWGIGGLLLLVGFLSIFQGGIILIFLANCCWVIAAIKSRLNVKALGEVNERLTGLLLDYIIVEDQSVEKVRRIQSLLMANFMHETCYEELLAEVASYTPGGGPGFRDEASLTEVFRAFLGRRKIAIIDTTGVWPPAPKTPSHKNIAQDKMKNTN